MRPRSWFALGLGDGDGRAGGGRGRAGRQAAPDHRVRAHRDLRARRRRSLAFYRDFLGYAEPFRLNRPGGTCTWCSSRSTTASSSRSSPRRRPGPTGSTTSPSRSRTPRRCAPTWRSRGVKVPDKVPVGPDRQRQLQHHRPRRPHRRDRPVPARRPDGWRSGQRPARLADLAPDHARRGRGRLARAGAGVLPRHPRLPGDLAGQLEGEGAELGQREGPRRRRLRRVHALQGTPDAGPAGHDAPPLPGGARHRAGEGGAGVAAGAQGLHPRHRDQDRHQPQAATQPVRPRRDPDRADGAEDGRRHAGALLPAPAP